MTRYMICTPTADIIHDPEHINIISKNDSQLLFGETFSASEDHGDWIYGTSDHDGYTGYVHKGQLIDCNKENKTSYFIDVRLSHVYPAPDFKTPPLMPLSFLSRVQADISRNENGFVPAGDMGWVYRAHLSEIGAEAEKDLVETALLFLNTPYLYGGRSSLGIDCSGLIQNTLLRHGIKIPRDSGDQEQALGSTIDQNDLKRGDFVFFKGHVGIMVDEKNILNATARHMRTLIEPLNDLINAYGNITACKRLKPK